jgi:hypothetical protein
MGLVLKVAAGVVLGLIVFSMLAVIGGAVLTEVTVGAVNRQRAACVMPVGIWMESTQQCITANGRIDAVTGAPIGPTSTPFPERDACQDRGYYWSYSENQCIGAPSGTRTPPAPTPTIHVPSGRL